MTDGSGALEAPGRSRITCVGEVLVDFLPIEEDGRTVGFRMHPGGSLFNVAMAVARLGGRVALVSKTGTDFFGRYLRGAVHAEGIDPTWLGEVDAPTTLGFVSTESGDPEFTFYGDAAADTLVAPEDLPDALLAETAILHVGSIALLRGTTPAAVLDACRRVHGRALLSLDPNLRPSLVRDEAAYRATLDALVGLVDVVKASAIDLAWLMPGRPIADAPAELIEHGVALAIVTRGADGLGAVRGGSGEPETFAVPTFTVPVADTVGAGDSFNGGLLARLAELGVTSRAALLALPRQALEGVLRFAAATAAINCTRPGADPPRHTDVEAFLSTAVPVAQ